MKKLIFFLLVLISCNTIAEFIHPMEFDGSDAQKTEVIEYIINNVKHDYCESGLDMCQETTLRMMEKTNLESFKESTKADNRDVMDRVINDYCKSGLDMCSYTNIWMMYKKNIEAVNQSLSW